MNITLSETQQLIRDSIREYLEKEVPFSRVRQVERDGGMDADLWQGLAGLGWLGLPFPEDLGGQGGELTDAGVLIEELTRRAVLIPIAETFAAAITIQRFGPADLAAGVVKKVQDGTMTISPAILEESDSFNTCDLQETNGTISGSKFFVDYGGQVSHHLVAANDAGGSALFLVENGPAVSHRSLSNIGKIPQSVVTYTNAPSTRVCGAEGLQFLLHLGRLFATIQCLGCSQQALDMTVEYVGMRVQFGRPIGTFQAVQHHCANMATHTLATRFLTYEALWDLDRGLATDTQIAVVKTEASRTATEVPMLAHQLHGGMGFVTEYDLHFFSLRGKQASLAWGSAEECLAAVANTIEEPEAWL
jgi:alkylation response protein AidB-like acyl-CoA dehydrogenase